MDVNINLCQQLRLQKNKLEKAINNSLLKKYLREIYLIGVSFIE